MKKNVLDLSSNSILPKEFLSILDDIADEIRPNYVNFISDLNLKYKNDIDWILTDLSSRNTPNCPLFENICKLELIKRLSSNNQINEVITNCPFFYKSIVKNLNNKLIIIDESKIIVTFFKILKNNLKKLVVLFYSYLSRFLISKIVRIKTLLGNKRSIIILESIIYENSFNNFVFKDRHYPGLLENTTETEKSTIFILPYYYGIWDFFKLFKKLKKTKTNFLIPENFLKFSDYYYAFFSFFRLGRKIKKIKNIKFNTIDVTDLVLDSYYKNIISIGSCEGIIRNRLIKRLKSKGVKIKKFIQWFENQPINKGTIISLKTHYPNTKITGHIGIFTSPNVIGLYPSKQELDCDLLPDEIAVIGKNLASLIKVYCPDLKTLLSPAFRFQDLLIPKSSNRLSKKFTILIILPIFKIDYTMILNLFGLVNTQISDYNLLIKTHPGSNHNFVSKILSDNNLIDYVTNKNIQDALASSNLVITSASSSALESVFSGKPTLLISNGSSVLKNPIPSNISSNLYSVCYNLDDIVNKIKYFMSLSNQQIIDLQKLSNFNITDYIEPNTLSATQIFLGLDKSVVNNE